MKTSPVIGLVLMMGAGVIWVARREANHEIQRMEVAPRLVAQSATPAAGKIAAPEAPEHRAEHVAVRMLVTAYCTCDICCGSWSKFARTATGKDGRRYDGVAADPKLLPYHTRLDIPGVGLREVDDTGGAMRQDAKRGITHIDVRMASHSEARRFGVKWLDVKVLK